MSLFSEVPLAAPDPILGTAVAFKADTNPKKINLGIGAYRTDDGRPYVFQAVRTAEAGILQEVLDKEYLPIDGLPELKQLTQNVLFGTNCPAIKEGRIASSQSLSGTGALRLVGDFIKHFLPACLTIREYPYWNSVRTVDTRELFKGAIRDLHRPQYIQRSVDLSVSQWESILSVCESRQLLPVLDSAYQGFASGDLSRDAFSVRLFATKFQGVLFVTQSFAKNLGLYGERVGMLHAICGSPKEAEAVLSQIKIVARRCYSSPPLQGARIVARVLGDEQLRRQWEEELKLVAERIKDMRRLLRKGLEQKGTPGQWNHITDQIGMFSYTGLTKEQCELLISKWHIYLLKNGRISMAGVNSSNIDYLVNAMDDVIRTIPSV
ncbi:hypothetical protein cyc_01530 [Cyclospora cayetanensis]|uniref:Aspartate aminotransferase n=1 Tax=Cyclospora cayetanensis TaxID=88456 RepID=A0A1D3D709_9EIME|nr:hypothetical protein cyc_01530 [Cyclospora cayetanensis]